jgi:hypothetical protein
MTTIGAVVLAGTITGVALLGHSAPSGAETPELAATQFLDALASKRLPDVAAMLAPSEVEEFTRLANASSGPPPTLSAIPGDTADAFKELWESATITSKDIEFDSEQLAEGVAKSTWTSGTITIDADKEALKTVLSAAIDPGGYNDMSPLDTAEIDETLNALPFTITPESLEQYGVEPFVVSVEERDKWFVSLPMTLAESALNLYNSFDPTVPIVRGDTLSDDEYQAFASPEAASEGLGNAMQQVDETGSLRPLAAVLPPAEGRLLAVYGPVFEAESVALAFPTIESWHAYPIHQANGTARLAIRQLRMYWDADSAFTLHSPAEGEYAIDTFTVPDNPTPFKLSFKAPDENMYEIHVATERGPSWMNTETDIRVNLTPEAVDVTATHTSGQEETSEYAIKATDDCLSFEFEGTVETHCTDEGSDALTQLLGRLAKLRESDTGLPRPEELFAISAVQVGNRWNVSVVATLGGIFTALGG